jgi:hypothetical protein
MRDTLQEIKTAFAAVDKRIDTLNGRLDVAFADVHNRAGDTNRRIDNFIAAVNAATKGA